MTNQDLITLLKAEKVLRSKRLEQALGIFDRANFVLPEHADEAYGNYPLPIGYGQTISQPLTVVFMLELLNAKEGQSVLEIGAGSGWQTALLAFLVGRKGSVVAMERILQLSKMAKTNVAKYPVSFRTCTIVHGDGVGGYPARAPYDRIIAAAAGDSIPQAWLEQLAPGGTIVAPVKYSILRVVKSGTGNIKTQEFPGFNFVPFVSG